MTVIQLVLWTTEYVTRRPIWSTDWSLAGVTARPMLKGDGAMGAKTDFGISVNQIQMGVKVRII